MEEWRKVKEGKEKNRLNRRRREDEKKRGEE